jgi:hypothetical protein
MYCPQCGSEYVEGVTECPECRVRLRPEPPREIRRKPKEFVEVVYTYNAGDVALIKSILDSEKVEYLFTGENFLQLFPCIQPATLLVRKEHLERARERLEPLKVTFLGVHS